MIICKFKNRLISITICNTKMMLLLDKFGSNFSWIHLQVNNLCFIFTNLILLWIDIINVPVVNAFILIIPWMIYNSKPKSNYNQIEELKNESHNLLAVNFFIFFKFLLLYLENSETRKFWNERNYIKCYF